MPSMIQPLLMPSVTASRAYAGLSSVPVSLLLLAAVITSTSELWIGRGRVADAELDSADLGGGIAYNSQRARAAAFSHIGS